MNLKNKYNLHLKYKFVIKELSKLTNNLQAKYNNIPFKLDTNNNILHAHTIDAINKNPNVLIGINNLTTDIHKLTNEINNTNTTTNTPNAFSRVPDLNFVTTIINIFHENRHINNALNKYQNCRSNKDDDNALLISYLAKHYNSYYYIEHYPNYLIEIDAEQSGILDAYDYLCYTYPKHKELWEKLIVDYVNFKAQNFTYFIYKSDGFTSLNEINTAFDESFDNSKSHKRNCTFLWQYSAPSNSIYEQIKQSKWKSIKEKILNTNNGITTDKMMASIVLYLHPEYQNYLSDINIHDLSAQNIFNEPFPDSPEETKLKEQRQQELTKKAEEYFKDILEKNKIQQNNEEYESP